MISKPEQVDLVYSEVAHQVNSIIESSKNCIDRGVDPESGKRGKCHVFRADDVCLCGAIDLEKERMK
jgi:hypothetical protein